MSTFMEVGQFLLYSFIWIAGAFIIVLFCIAIISAISHTMQEKQDGRN